MNDPNRIVAVGLLSAADLERLGPGFQHAYLVEDEHPFEDLVETLDRIPWLAGPDDAGERDPSQARSARS